MKSSHKQQQQQQPHSIHHIARATSDPTVKSPALVHSQLDCGPHTHIHRHTGNQMMSSLLSKLPPFPCFTLFFPRSTLRSFCFFCFLPMGCWSSFVRTDSLRLLLLFFCFCCANSRFGNRVGCGEEFVPKAREFRFWQMEIFLFCHWVQGYCAGTIILLRLRNEIIKRMWTRLEWLFLFLLIIIHTDAHLEFPSVRNKISHILTVLRCKFNAIIFA